MELEEVIEGIRPYLVERGWISAEADATEEERLRLVARSEKERLRYFAQITDLAAWVFDGDIEFEPKALKNLRKDGAADLLKAYAPVLLEGNFEDPALMEEQARVWVQKQEVGFGKLVHPLRAALTRRTSGPGLFDCAQLLGPEECRRRIETALEAAASAS